MINYCMDESRQIKWGIILSYVTQFVTVFSGLIYTPVMIRLLGQSEYGLYNLSGSVVSFLGVLNFGFSSGYLRLYFKYKTNLEEDKIHNLNGMYLIIFSCISIITALCGVLICTNVDAVFSTGLSEVEKERSSFLMAIMIYSLIITFMSSIFDCYISAHSQFIFQRGLQVLKSICNPFISFPLLLLGYGSIGLSVVTAVLTTFCFIASVYYCMCKIRMRFKCNRIEKRTFVELSKFAFYIFISSIVDKINLSLDNYLLGRICGTSVVAIYGVGSQINGFFCMISSTIATVFAPQINRLVAENSLNKLSDLFIGISQVLFIVLLFVLIGFVSFGQQFISMWVGDAYEISYYVSLLLMAGCFIQFLQVCGIEIQKSMNMHKFRSLLYLFVALINVCISIPLIKYYGAIGASFGTFITMVLGSGLCMNLYYHRVMKLDMVRYWKHIVLTLPIFIPSVFVVLLFKFIGKGEFVMVFSSALLFTLFFAISVVFYYRQNRLLCVNILKRNL